MFSVVRLLLDFFMRLRKVNKFIIEEPTAFAVGFSFAYCCITDIGFNRSDANELSMAGVLEFVTTLDASGY